MLTQYSARTLDVDKIRAAQDLLVCKIRVNEGWFPSPHEEIVTKLTSAQRFNE